MRISSFELHNFKSFKDSPALRLSSGFNVIVGQNNVGKSAFLEALSLSFNSCPHKSLLSVPYRGARLDERSSAKVTFSMTGEELRNLLWNDLRGFYIAQPSEAKLRDDGVIGLLQNLFEKGEIDLSFSLMSRDSSPAIFTLGEFPSGNLYTVLDPNSPSHHFNIIESGEKRFDFKVAGATNANRDMEFGVPLAGILRSMIYRFKAERLSLSRSPYGQARILRPDAANLPEVLMNLQSENPERYKRFNSYVRKVFPSIFEVRAVNAPDVGNSVDIAVWTEDPKTERSDLAIPLEQSGTGVGQVLAIIYVVITSEFPRVIIIDEPNSFLHPSAARKLIEILRRDFPKHQYIITTHSPEIIRAANASSLTLIKWQKPESVIEQLNSSEVGEVQKCLVEVGAKLSDVFGADHILWVEGETEEECFRRILDEQLKLPALGLSIVAVRNTGDFESKRIPASLIFNIYKKLSMSNALLPPAVAIVFDREGRTKKEIENLERASNSRVKFLHRRMYENYLLCPKALEAVMKDLETFRDSPVSEDQIAIWLKDKGGKTKYFNGNGWNGDLTGKKWLAEVHAANLLKDLFLELSDSKQEYSKTVHSVELTEWLIKNKPDALSEIADFLLGIVAPVN